MLGGEISYSAETVSVRGKLANSGTEQAENSPGDTPPGNISPVVDKNLLLNARDPSHASAVAALQTAGAGRMLDVRVY